jgi:hypothetical protein
MKNLKIYNATFIGLVLDAQIIEQISSSFSLPCKNCIH